jgi:hypothetical protein
VRMKLVHGLATSRACPLSPLAGREPAPDLIRELG